MTFAQTVVDNGKTYKESVISIDYRKTHGILVEDAVDPQQAPAYRQLTSGLAAEAQNRASAIATTEANLAAARAALEALLNTETQARIAGDQVAEQRLQQAMEGVSKRAVAARYDGAAAPTLADVPGIDTAASADDWRSWFLWDQGTGNANTGIYTFAGSTPTRVPTVTLEAGLLVFVNSGTFADTQWLMIDDPVNGVADFVPWQRVSEFTATGPLHKEANILRLAFEAQYLTTRINPDTGEVELTIAQAFRDRLTTAESNITGLRTDVTGLQGNVTGLRTDVTGLRTDVGTLQQADANFTTQINGLLAADVAQTGRLTTLETSQVAQDSAIAGLQSADTAFNTRLGTTEGNVTNLQASDQEQTTRLGALETSQAAQDTAIGNLQAADTAITGRLGTAEGNITSLQTSDAAQTNRLGTLETSQAAQDSAITSLQNADTAFNTRLGTTEGNVTALQTSDAQQTTRLNGLDTLVATKVDATAVTASINAYDRATKIIRPFTVTNTVQQGNIYVHTLDCATGLGSTDFVMAEARFTADTPLRRLDTPPQYITPDTCRILVEGTDATIGAGAVEGFFERFYR